MILEVSQMCTTQSEAVVEQYRLPIRVDDCGLTIAGGRKEDEIRLPSHCAIVELKKSPNHLRTNGKLTTATRSGRSYSLSSAPTGWQCKRDLPSKIPGSNFIGNLQG